MVCPCVQKQMKILLFSDHIEIDMVMDYENFCSCEFSLPFGFNKPLSQQIEDFLEMVLLVAPCGCNPDLCWLFGKLVYLVLPRLIG